jgi:osmoprotectant transport system substrate-binding protein
MEDARAGHNAIMRCMAAVALCIALLLGAVGCAPPRPDRPVIGAKNFTEQVVLGELLAQHIEARTGLKVDRRFYLAGSYICQQALVAGRIDGYVEYTGTALTAILKQPVDKDPARVLATIQRLYRERYAVDAGNSLGFENTFAMIVRSEDAERLHVRRLSQAAAVAPQWSSAWGMSSRSVPTACVVWKQPTD